MWFKKYLRSTRIVFTPSCDKLSEMVGPQNGWVSSQVIKVVHDDGHEEVEHDERAQEDEGDKVDVGQGGATVLAWVEQPTWSVQERVGYFTRKLNGKNFIKGTLVSSLTGS